MKVERLYVRHFRNLETQEILFSSGAHEFIGKNAQGKTTILEALWALVLGVSFRTSLLKELVSYSKDAFFLEATVDTEGVKKDVALGFDGTSRHVLIDGQRQETTSLLFGNVLGVCATLHDNELVFGAPSVRRQFLDEQIAQIDPFFVEHLSRFKRGLSQRNRLLKKREQKTLDAWEEQLALSGAYIIQERRKTVSLLSQKISPLFSVIFSDFPNSFEMSIHYTSQPPEEEKDLVSWLIKEMQTRRNQEMHVGTTLVGPHRDDLEFRLQGNLLRRSASLGQARSIAFLLRYAEWQLLQERSHEVPLFLFDDIESTLDQHRKQEIIKLCTKLGQVFFTGHTAQCEMSHVYRVSSGKVERCANDS